MEKRGKRVGYHVTLEKRLQKMRGAANVPSRGGATWKSPFHASLLKFIKTTQNLKIKNGRRGEEGSVLYACSFFFSVLQFLLSRFLFSSCSFLFSFRLLLLFHSFSSFYLPEVRGIRAYPYPRT